MPRSVFAIFSASVLACASASAADLSAPDVLNVEAAFQDFTAHFQKRYSDSELKRRFELFKANYIFIENMNSRGLPFRMKVNEFADLTLDEFTSTHLGSRPMLEQFRNSSLQRYSGVHLSDGVDWVERGAVTPVKNQASCGSCWTFATTGTLEGAYQISTGQLVSLSEQQFVDCDVDQTLSGHPEDGECCFGCNGGNAAWSISFAIHHNICTEDGYAAYSAVQNKCVKKCTKVGIPSGTVTGFRLVDSDQHAVMEAVMKGPCAVAVDAAGAFMFYQDGVLTELCGGNLDHAVLAVGYGTDTASKKPYWKVKNSWGPKWGEKGYIRLVRGHNGAGTLSFVALGNFATDSQTHQALHYFLGVTYTDSGKTVNGSPVFVAYGRYNTAYALYKCPLNMWMVDREADMDPTTCKGYASSPRNADISGTSTGWMEYDPSEGSWFHPEGAGVTRVGTVKSECGILKQVNYPVLAGAGDLVV